MYYACNHTEKKRKKRTNLHYYIIIMDEIFFKKSKKVNVFILTLNGRRHYWQKRYVKAFDDFSRRFILNSSPFMAVLKTDDVDI